MYAAYALSSIMNPSQPLTEIRAAGVIPALISVLNTAKHLASKKGAMRALGRLARVNESAVEIVDANGLPPIIALLDCVDKSLIKRSAIGAFFLSRAMCQYHMRTLSCITFCNSSATIL